MQKMFSILGTIWRCNRCDFDVCRRQECVYKCQYIVLIKDEYEKRVKQEKTEKSMVNEATREYMKSALGFVLPLDVDVNSVKVKTPQQELSDKIARKREKREYERAESSNPNKSRIDFALPAKVKTEQSTKKELTVKIHTPSREQTAEAKIKLKSKDELKDLLQDDQYFWYMTPRSDEEKQIRLAREKSEQAALAQLAKEKSEAAFLAQKEKKERELREYEISLARKKREEKQKPTDPSHLRWVRAGRCFACCRRSDYLNKIVSRYSPSNHAPCTGFVTFPMVHNGRDFGNISIKCCSQNDGELDLISPAAHVLQRLLLSTQADTSATPLQENSNGSSVGPVVEHMLGNAKNLYNWVSRKTNILELGSGTGFVGLSLAKCGFHVMMSDGMYAAVENIRTNWEATQREPNHEVIAPKMNVYKNKIL